MVLYAWLLRDLRRVYMNHESLGRSQRVLGHSKDYA